MSRRPIEIFMHLLQVPIFVWNDRQLDKLMTIINSRILIATSYRFGFGDCPELLEFCCDESLYDGGSIFTARLNKREKEKG